MNSLLLAMALGSADKPITVEEVNAAQQAWCDGLIKIGAGYAAGKDYKKTASDFLDAMYDFKEAKVFFKPTLAFGNQTFRTSKAGAMSYFVGGDSRYGNDKGFALTPWVNVRFTNAGGRNI
jgi:hypothetical protein